MISPGYEKALFRSKVPLRLTQVASGVAGPNAPAFQWIGREHEQAPCIRSVVEAVVAIVRTHDAPFQIVSPRGNHSLRTMRASEAGEQLVRALLQPFDQIEESFPDHQFNPLFVMLRRCHDDLRISNVVLRYWSSARGEEADSICLALNAAVQSLRQQWTSSAMTSALDGVRRNHDKRLRSARRALLESAQDCSLLLPVRLDLFFYRGPCASEAPHPVSLDLAQQCVVKFQRHLREHFPLVRSIRVRQHGPETGPQFQVLALLNAHLAPDAKAVTDKLGAYWKKMSPQGMGGYASHHGPNAGASPQIFDAHSRHQVRSFLNSVLKPMVQNTFWLREASCHRSLVISQRFSRRTRLHHCAREIPISSDAAHAQLQIPISEVAAAIHLA